MPAAVKTSVTELPESRVRVEAEVPAEEIERRMQATARQLGRNLRMPGFRKGKVPPPVVIQRVGRDMPSSWYRSFCPNTWSPKAPQSWPIST